MNSGIVLELLRIVVPALIGTGATAFYFQRKLKRAGTYQKATDLLTERLVLGTDLVFADMLYLRRKMRELADAVQRGDKATVAASREEFGQAMDKHFDTIQTHRIYIAALVPFGHSSKFHGEYHALWRAISAYERHPDAYNEFQDEVRERCAALEADHDKYADRVMEIQRQILQGDLVV